MTVLEILANTPNGEIITNKIVLNALKRKGLIYDYSPWGYLESQWVYSWCDYGDGPERRKKCIYAGRALKEGEKGTFENPFKDYDQQYKAGYDMCPDIIYKGYKFRTKYLSGCFNAYLEKVSGPDGNTEKTINRSISCFGSIM